MRAWSRLRRHARPRSLTACVWAPVARFGLTATAPAARSQWSALRTEALPELRATATVLRHATGALLVHIDTADEHAYFSVAFRTPVAHDRGTPHVLEHIALSGSAAYDATDVFHAMSARSVHTDMNAVTASDHTSYYFSTTNAADHANLRAVFLDAVLRPRLREEDFLAEGVRIEPEDASRPRSSPLVLRGVVYNEMQGHAASPGEALNRAVYGALLPGTPYAANAGGDPRSIPDLTVAEVRAFHGAHYAPGRALFVAYGARPPLADVLADVGAALDGAATGGAAPAWEVAATTPPPAAACDSAEARPSATSRTGDADTSADASLAPPSPGRTTLTSSLHSVPVGDAAAAGAGPRLLRVRLPPDGDDAGEAASAPTDAGGGAHGDGRCTVLRAWRVGGSGVPPADPTTIAAGAAAPAPAAPPAPHRRRSAYADLVLRLAVDLLMAGTQSPLYVRLVASGLAAGFAPGCGADTGAGDAAVVVLGGAGVRAEDADAADGAIVAALRDAVTPPTEAAAGAHGGRATARAPPLGAFVDAFGVLHAGETTRARAAAAGVPPASDADAGGDDTDPFSAARVEAALHQLEFGLRAPSPALGATLAGIVTERWAAGCGAVVAADAEAAAVGAALLEPLRVRDMARRLRRETVGRADGGDAGALLRAALRAATLDAGGDACVRVIGVPDAGVLAEAESAEAARLALAEAAWAPAQRDAAAAAARARAAAAEGAGDGGASRLPLLPLSAISRTAPDSDAARTAIVAADAAGRGGVPLAVAAGRGNNGVATLRLLFRIAMPSTSGVAAAVGAVSDDYGGGDGGAGSPAPPPAVLAPHLHAWMPLFATTALGFGTRARAPGAWDLATRRALGRLSASVVTAAPSVGGGPPLYGLLVEAAWLAGGDGGRTADALALLAEALAEGAPATARLQSRDRALLGRSLRAAAVDAAQGVADAAGAYAASAAGAWVNPVAALREVHGGRAQARFLLSAGGDDGAGVGAAAAAFQEIATALFVRRSWAAAGDSGVTGGADDAPVRALLTVDPEHEDACAAAVDACLRGALPEQALRRRRPVTGARGGAATQPRPPPSPPPRLLLRAPSHVHALALALPAPPWGAPSHAHVQLGLAALAAARLHGALRTVGGAYDVSARVSTADVALVCTGEDPAPLASLKAVVRAACAAAAPGGLSPADLHGAQLAVAAELDAPLPPSARGVSRLLYGVTPGERQAHRDAVLGATLADVRRALDEHVATPLARGAFGAAIAGPVDELQAEAVAEAAAAAATAAAAGQGRGGSARQPARSRRRHGAAAGSGGTSTDDMGGAQLAGVGACGTLGADARVADAGAVADVSGAVCDVEGQWATEDIA